MTTIGLRKTLAEPFDQALTTLTDALKSEGFGVLTRVDVNTVLKEKLGVDFRRYTILGACNPGIANRALSTNLAAGLMMPCNVTLHDDGGKTVVQVVDPTQTFAMQLGPDMTGIANEVREKLLRVVEKLPGA
jgi:uncharacterized protein (DUF302 family)